MLSSEKIGVISTLWDKPGQEAGSTASRQDGFCFSPVWVKQDKGQETGLRDADCDRDMDRPIGSRRAQPTERRSTSDK